MEVDKIEVRCRRTRSRVRSVLPVMVMVIILEATMAEH